MMGISSRLETDADHNQGEQGSGDETGSQDRLASELVGHPAEYRRGDDAHAGKEGVIDTGLEGAHLQCFTEVEGCPS